MCLEKTRKSFFVVISIFIVVFFNATTYVAAGNPVSPIEPTDNIQDPGDPGTAWGGCGPSDSNCYVTVTGGISDGDKGDIVVSGSGSTFSIDTDVIDWADIADATILDASTAISFGGSTFGLSFNNDGSGNEIHNLSSTGDFIIQDNGTAFVIFDDSGNSTFEGSAVFNESGADKDFRIEGDANSNLFFVDASSDAVGIGTSTPTSLFEVYHAGNGPGTVETNGTTTLTGTGTNFTTTFRVGSTISVSGETARTVNSILSDTSLTVTVAFSTTASGLSYAPAAGRRLAVGNSQLFIGSLKAGSSNSGTSTVFGIDALRDVTALAYQNDAFGYVALRDNTTGFDNSAFGSFSLANNLTGVSNVAIGRDAMFQSENGSYNTAIGIAALYDMATSAGSYNTAIGRSAGRGITTGSYNTIIGAYTTGLSSSLSNTVIIADGSNTGSAAWRFYSPSSGNVLFGSVTDQTGFKLQVTGKTYLSNELNIGSTSDAGAYSLQVTGGAITDSLTISSISGSTQCLQVDASGVVSGTGSACGAGSGANTALSNLASVAINTSLISDTDITDDLGSAAIRWKDIYTQTIGTGDTDTDTFTLRARDVDGAVWTDFITLTAGNTPTATMSGVTASSNFTPTVTDGASLGTTALNWSDLFLDLGSVIDFNSGDVTITHSSNFLTIAGGTLTGAALGASTDSWSSAWFDDSGAISWGWDGVSAGEATLTHTTGVGVTLSGTSRTAGQEFRILSKDTTIDSTNVLGSLVFRGTDSTARTGAQILAKSAGIWGVDANDAPTNLEFYTQVAGAANELASPRMVIDSTGNIGIGDATPLALLTVGSGDLFQVNSSGAIAAITGFTQASGNFNMSASTGTFTTGTGAVSLNGDTTIASGKTFRITGGAGNPTATNGIIWYDTTANKIKIVENGTVKTVCNTTDAGCGAGGSTTWDTIGDPAGNGSIAMGATVQTMDWASATTQTALSLTSNSLTSGIILSISSNGTGALTDQTGLDIALLGANGTAGQTTYGAVISNAHTGTGSTNYGLYTEAINGAQNYALTAVATGGTTTLSNTAGSFTNGGAGTNFDPVAIFRNTEATAYTQIALEGTGNTWTFGVGNASESGFGLANNFYIYDYTGTAVRMVIDTSGRVGVGDLSPDYLLDVANTGIDGNIFTLTDSDGECLYNPESGSVTVSCSSDERLKENIVDAPSVLEYFKSFRVREYSVIASGDMLTGVIAQEVMQLHPDLVTLGANGLYSVELPNQWKVVKAIQELDANIESIKNLVDEPGGFLDNIRAWLADTANGIGDIVGGRLRAKDEICVGVTCITEGQLQELMQQAGMFQQASTSYAPQEDTTQEEVPSDSTPQSEPTDEITNEVTPDISPSEQSADEPSGEATTSDSSSESQTETQ